MRQTPSLMILLSLTFQDMIKASLIFDLVWRRNDYNQLVKHWGQLHPYYL